MDVLFVIPPSVYLGLLLATFICFTFHAVMGRRENSGFFYLPFGVAGFAGGALAAILRNACTWRTIASPA